MNIGQLGLSLNETRKLESNVYLTKNSEDHYTITIAVKPTESDLTGIARELNAESVKNKGVFLDTVKLVFENNTIISFVLNATSKYVLDIEKSNNIYVIDKELVYYIDLTKTSSCFRVSAKSPSYFESVNKALFGVGHSDGPKDEVFTQATVVTNNTLMNQIKEQVKEAVKAKNPAAADMWLNVADKVSKRGW